ncbi:hypothetical protein [Paenibacillus sp. UMB7766-LJ446]
MAYHVLEAMHGIHDASRDGKHYVMESRYSRRRRWKTCQLRRSITENG